MSNLPPGVSENDPHIAGYPEIEIDVECREEGVEWTLEDEYGAKWQVYFDCPWKGKADALVNGWSIEWNCPLCQTLHEDEREEME